MEQQVYRSPNAHRKPPKRRRPRWGRIGGVLLALALVAVAALFLPRLLREGPATDSQSADSQSTASQRPSAPDDTLLLTENAAAIGGLVKGAADPTLSLRGARTVHTRPAQFGSYDADYLYEYLPIGTDFRPAGLVCFDRAARKLSWVCSQPGCTHQGPECPGYLPDGIQGWAYRVGDELLLLHYDAVDRVCTLYRCGLDGSDRTEVLHIDGLGNPTPLFAPCEEAVVFCLGGTTYQTDTRDIYVYDKASHSVQVLLQLDRKVVPLDIWDGVLSFFYQEGDDVTTYAALDLDTAEQRTMLQYQEVRGNERRLIGPELADGALYFMRQKDSETCEFVREDVASGAQTVLNDAIFFPENYTAGLMKQGIQDTRFTYCIAPNDPQAPAQDADFVTYVLDVTTGQPAPEAVDMQMGIWHAIFDDMYLVSLSDQIERNDLWLINKADYWAGNKNYIPIENTTT